MNHSMPTADKLEFYVVNNIRYEKDGDQYIRHQNLTLPKAISIYNGYGTGKTSALGVSNGTINTDLVQRLEGENTLVSDYQQMDEWKYNPYLCISTVSMLIANLDIHRQMDAHCVTRPLAERLHVMRLKDEENLHPCLFKSLDTIQKMGMELTMDQYDLIFSEPVKPGEALVDVCNRYRLTSPKAYQGYAPTVSDVLVYQTRKGCHALYIDSIGFELMQRFVRPPGQGDPKSLLTDPLYSAKGAADR